ncbi:MAG TPA: AMP-binding protein, partial [Acidimicrobiales bacterium]|nr:AMP-binding protein [Acidimicrobiales bacterium]
MSPPSRQSGPDALVEELVGGVLVRCYAQRPTSLVDLLERALVRSADVLLVDPALGRTVTYEEFAALVEGAAASLRERGLRDGDRVAVLVRNGLEAAVAIWACARAGLVHVGLPADAPPARLADLVALTSPSLVLAQPDLAEAGQLDAEDAVVLLS